MAISLTKGQRIDLTKNNTSLKKVLVGLGWDPIKKRGFFGSTTPQIDIDASVIMLKDDRVKSKDDVIYFGNLKSKCGGVLHTGDNLTGDGDGDDEQIIVDLPKVNSEVNKLIFVINIYGSKNKRQDFGMIENAFIRVANKDNNENIAMYNLTDNYQGKTSVIVGEVYRHGSEWKFAAIGEGTTDASISEIIKKYQ